jgi:hypothetical protein
LAGVIARDLILERPSAERELPMATVRAFPLPPSPLRGLVLRATQRALQRIDDTGGQSGLLGTIALRFLQGGEARAVTQRKRRSQSRP